MKIIAPIALISFIPAILLLTDIDRTRGNAAGTITIAELHDHMFFLASNELAGRSVGSDGFRMAANYGISQFRAAGIKPILKDSAGRPSYLQNVPIIKRSVEGVISLKFRTPVGEHSFDGEGNIKAVYTRRITPSEKLNNPVFVGFGIEEPDCGWNDFEGLDLTDRIAIMLHGSPMREGKPVLPEELHRKYMDLNQSLRAKLENIARYSPSSVLLVSDDQIDMFWKLIQFPGSNERYSLANDESEADSEGPPSFYLIKRDVAIRLFEGQDFDPEGITKKDLSGYRTFELKGVSGEVLHQYVEQEVETWNIVGRLEGTDPEVRDQYISVGAHLDHLPPNSSWILNGADDNASGSAGLIEVAEALAVTPPRRSVLFILFTAEELGLLGSRYFVDHSPVPLEKIIANLNLDMIGRSDESNRESRAHYVVAEDKICIELKEILVEVNERTVNWPLVISATPDCRCGGSDHANFLKKGIPALHFFSGKHAHHHMPSDDAETIDYEKMQKISQLVYELAMELGNRDSALMSQK